MAQVRIGERAVGEGAAPLVVAELSANHNGSLARAEEVLRAVAEAGAEAVKFQTYTADTITLDSDSEEFRIGSGPWAGRRLWDLYDEAHTPWEWHERLFGLARELGLIAFSTPFDATALEFLEGFDPPVYKIASFEAVDLPLIERVAATGKPLIISTGMADLEEIGEAVEAAGG
ncbi:MAG: N-acetylneuraminate synthase family protein, partial [Thermoleophilaceae bacterium]|nr:N-acetylneuraminate synthase family protein [Thermoleophilaceae bacterium]